MTVQQQYSSLREKISAEKVARIERYARFAEAFAKAQAAGLAAGEAFEPRPMIVGNAIGLSDAIDPDGPIHYVPDGVCGFAWVRLAGTSSFAKWLVKNGHAKAGYYGGVDIWIWEHNQSYERKVAHASAMADVLRDELGINCYAGSRLD